MAHPLVAEWLASQSNHYRPATLELYEWHTRTLNEVSPAAVERFLASPGAPTVVRQRGCAVRAFLRWAGQRVESPGSRTI